MSDADEALPFLRFCSTPKILLLPCSHALPNTPWSDTYPCSFSFPCSCAGRYYTSTLRPLLPWFLSLKKKTPSMALQSCLSSTRIIGSSHGIGAAALLIPRCYIFGIVHSIYPTGKDAVKCISRYVHIPITTTRRSWSSGRHNCTPVTKCEDKRYPEPIDVTVFHLENPHQKVLTNKNAGWQCWNLAILLTVPTADCFLSNFVLGLLTTARSFLTYILPHIIIMTSDLDGSPDSRRYSLSHPDNSTAPTAQSVFPTPTIGINDIVWNDNPCMNTVSGWLEP